MSGHRLLIALVAFWLVVGGAYFCAAVQQKQRLNLSAASGGQYPYLTCAKRMAEAGVTRYSGDRNRMPLYPALLTLVYDENWDTFVDRSAWFAIVSSMAILLSIGWAAYRFLPPWSATALTLAAAFCVFIYKASFVQAELLYYGLLFGSWLLLCDLIRRPGVWRSIVAGVLLALTFLTKASALLTVATFVAAMGVLAIVRAVQAKGKRSGKGSESRQPRPAPVLIAAVAVALSFLAIVYPYISSSKARFDRYFYNVNSTFFMWCDSWAEAKSFAEAHKISEHYPEADPEQIPGPLNYRRTHSFEQVLHRFAYGVKTLGLLAFEGPYSKYLALAVAFCVGFGIKRARFLRSLPVEDWVVGLFCGVFFVGYALTYAWYAPVAYGDRFLLSLFLPAMFATLWLTERFSRTSKPVSAFGRAVRKSDAWAILLVALLLCDGTRVVTSSLYRANAAFVQFYYNESRELQASGNLREAAKGFEGVAQLDPSFAQAHHELGMIALRTGRLDDAVRSFTKAVNLRPRDANMHNSLGSALIQAGRTDEAIHAFKQATELDPTFATAWYNLGGSYCLLGAFDRARTVRKHLDALDTELARKLAVMIDE